MAKRVDVVVGDADDDCVLIIMIFMAFLIIGLYAVMSFSPAPLSGSEAAAEVLLLQRVLLSKATHAQNTSDLSNLVCGGCVVPHLPPPAVSFQTLLCLTCLIHTGALCLTLGALSYT